MTVSFERQSPPLQRIVAVGSRTGDLWTCIPIAGGSGGLGRKVISGPITSGVPAVVSASDPLVPSGTGIDARYVDWHGPADANGRPYVLLWRGPKGRYFQHFSLGNAGYNVRESTIWMRGVVLATLPKAVVAAALNKRGSTWYVRALCADYSYVYAYEAPLVFTTGGMLSSAFTLLGSVYMPDLVTGMDRNNTRDFYNVYFFNRSGTEAVGMVVLNWAASSPDSPPVARVKFTVGTSLSGTYLGPSGARARTVSRVVSDNRAAVEWECLVGGTPSFQTANDIGARVATSTTSDEWPSNSPVLAMDYVNDDLVTMYVENSTAVRECRNTRELGSTPADCQPCTPGDISVTETWSMDISDPGVYLNINGARMQLDTTSTADMNTVWTYPNDCGTPSKSTTGTYTTLTTSRSLLWADLRYGHAIYVEAIVSRRDDFNGRYTYYEETLIDGGNERLLKRSEETYVADIQHAYDFDCNWSVGSGDTTTYRVYSLTESAVVFRTTDIAQQGKGSMYVHSRPFGMLFASWNSSASNSPDPSQTYLTSVADIEDKLGLDPDGTGHYTSVIIPL